MGPTYETIGGNAIDVTSRYRLFFRRMFPLPVMIPIGATAFLVVYLALQALAHQTPLWLTGRAIAGTITVILFSLLMRIYDELKDAETDVRLAAAGDPNYQDRPIVTGAITIGDLNQLRWLVTALLVGLNIGLGYPFPLIGFAFAFFVMWLSFKWFFCPAISRNLLLAFVTHNPIALVISGYVVTVYLADFQSGRLTEWTVPLLVGTWLPVAAWETSRKIRLPQDETTYQTYSKMLGLTTAALLPPLFVFLSLACLLPVSRAAGLGWYFGATLMAAATIVVTASALLLIAPTTRRAHLRPYAELYAVVVNLGMTIAVAIRHGVVWG